MKLTRRFRCRAATGRAAPGAGWIYPYRGKYHPQMVRALLNIVGAKPGSRILDPYLGSGTTALEASLLGIDCVGVDISPLCVLLTRVKTRSVEAVAEIRDRVHALLALDTLDPSDASIASDGNAIVADFVEIARMTTLSDVSRRNRDGQDVAAEEPPGHAGIGRSARPRPEHFRD